MQVSMYLVNLRHNGLPHLRRERVEVVTGKWTWAIDRKGGRHLVGASAFYTLASACRVRLALLLRTATDSYVRFKHPMLHGKAESEVRAWQTRGVAGWKIKDYT